MNYEGFAYCECNTKTAHVFKLHYIAGLYGRFYINFDSMITHCDDKDVTMIAQCVG